MQDLRNALAINYINLNNNLKTFYNYYDSNAVGKYCKERDPRLYR